METLLITISAINIAKQIRGRSLSWLRKQLVVDDPQMISLDMQVLEKLRQAKCALSRRQLLRSFHRMHRQELDEAIAHLQSAGLVHDHAGKALAV